MAYEILTDEALEERLDRQTATVSQLSVVAMEGCDAPWASLLDGVLAVAGQMPYGIGFATRP